MNYLKCDTCGKFFSLKEIEKGGGASSLFVPGAVPISYEEWEWRCKKCTKKHGAPISNQNVDHKLCTTIY